MRNLSLASILGLPPRKSLPRSTLTKWVGGINHDCLIYTIHPGQFQVGWDSMANVKGFFLFGLFFCQKKKKEHLILAYKCKFWAWSSNLILMCQHLEIQCKDNVLKNSEVELHWPLAQIRPSEEPRLSQHSQT